MHYSNNHDAWGTPPWEIDFHPVRRSLPAKVDIAIVGAGFTGLAAAAWLRLIAPEKTVAVLEAQHIGAGASGRTGGMALSETAAGPEKGVSDVLGSLEKFLKKLRIDCELNLNGAWEIARHPASKSKRSSPRSPIEWNDSGTLRVVSEVPGGTLHPGKLVSGLARAAHRQGAILCENHRVEGVEWNDEPKLHLALGAGRFRDITTAKIIFATNALSLEASGLSDKTHPRLTLAILAKPVAEKVLKAIGLADRKPFYTADLPYLWGRVRRDRSIVWGAGLVQSPDADLEHVDIAAADTAQVFNRLEERLRNLHPLLAETKFTHRWGGPILFSDTWKPIFDWHPQSVKHGKNSKSAIVVGAYAGHGVALSSYLGKWAAEAALGRRKLPAWGAIGS
jgi:glycine/D-amino acid oxidase-like deaminating enzyme